MKKAFLSMMLSSLIFICVLTFTSCGGENGGAPGGAEGGGDTETIHVPQYKDYARGTVDFSSVKYSRPDYTSVISAFDTATSAIKENETDFDSQLNMIIALEDDYADISTMGAYANIRFQQNTADEYWASENEYITTSHPDFSFAVERLLVAAANSENALRFENEYFGEGFVEEYKDGGIYDEVTVQLMKKEAQTEAEYSSLSTATVEITYDGMTDTVDEILSHLETIYGKESIKYKRAEEECLSLYESELMNKSSFMLVELFKIRRAISDNLNYDSYSDFAYETIYHDYSCDDFLDLISDVSKYITPVYVKLSNYVFNQYEVSTKTLSREKLVNDVGCMLKNADAELYDAYSYMLQHSLFDIEKANPTRFDGAFTSYLESYNAPFIFISTDSTANDYSTLCHEFGHFFDYFVNYSSDASLDISEISSLALEYLALTKFDGVIPASTIKELTVCMMEDALSTLIFQGFYSAFEHFAYEIEYDNISEESLNLAVVSAAKEIGLNTDIINNISYVSIPHIFLYPFYVQSYCTASVVSLQIYFTELDSEGEGFSAYKKLVGRDGECEDFEEILDIAHLRSPFEDDYLKSIADRIHYELLGTRFYKDNLGDNVA